MPKRTFVVDIDLNQNQLIKAVVHNSPTDPPTPAIGQIYWNTANLTMWGWTGAVWLNLGVQGGGYTHDNFTALTPTLTGANVLATFETNIEGHVIAATTRLLTLADLGYTAYSHPLDGVDLGAALTGANVISDVEVNAAGHVTGFATRAMTAADVGAAIINDLATNGTDTWSSTKITAEIAAALSGIPTPTVLAYDAATNTPDLDVTAVGVVKGDIFHVTVAGTFFTEDVQIGDTLIAKIDDPAVLADWIRLEKNINIVAASETSSGIIEIATQTEVNTGTDAVRAVTPATLTEKLTAFGSGTTKKYSQNIGDAAATAITVTHNLGSVDVTMIIKETATNEIVECQITTPTINTAIFTFNVAPSLNQYRVVIIG